MPSPTTDPGSDVTSLTDEVAAFIVGTRPEDIPQDVAHLGKRSVLDGIGLALAGAAVDQRAAGSLARVWLRGRHAGGP